MKYVVTLLAGLTLGGLLTYFVIIRAPRMEKPPGEPARGAPEVSGDTTATATVTLDEQFFNKLMAAIFRDLGTPKFGTSGEGQPAPSGECQGQIEIVELGSGGARTGVRLQNDRIVAPLAFNGTFAPVTGVGPCVNFSGTAEADITLHYDSEQQTLFGFLSARTVTLDSLGPEYTPLATSLVQTVINQRINPITILRGQQLTLALPVRAANGTLNTQAREMRSEVSNGTLRLFVTYEFAGARGTPTPEPSPKSP